MDLELLKDHNNIKRTKLITHKKTTPNKIFYFRNFIS